MQNAERASLLAQVAELQGRVDELTAECERLRRALAAATAPALAPSAIVAAPAPSEEPLSPRPRPVLVYSSDEEYVASPRGGARPTRPPPSPRAKRSLSPPPAARPAYAASASKQPPAGGTSSANTSPRPLPPSPPQLTVQSARQLPPPPIPSRGLRVSGSYVPRAPVDAANPDDDGGSSEPPSRTSGYESVGDDAPPPPVRPPPSPGPAPMRIQIGSMENVGDGTLKKVQLFVMQVEYGDDSWLVCRRYNAFHRLWTELQHQTSHLLPFPPKKLKLALDSSEASRRKALLQKFLDEIVRMPHLSGSPEFMQFVDPLIKPSMFGISLLDVQVESELWHLVEQPFGQSEFLRRHCVLVSGRLFWFRNDQSVEPLGELALDYCTCDSVDTVGSVDGQPCFSFVVKHLLRSEETFAATSATTRRNWVVGIRQARAAVSGGTIGATVDQFELERNTDDDHSALDDGSKPAVRVLKGFASGHVRLSTFATVPDTVSSMMGTLAFEVERDTPDQILFKLPAVQPQPITRSVENSQEGLPQAPSPPRSMVASKESTVMTLVKSIGLTRSSARTMRSDPPLSRTSGSSAAGPSLSTAVAPTSTPTSTTVSSAAAPAAAVASATGASSAGAGDDGVGRFTPLIDMRPVSRSHSLAPQPLRTTQVQEIQAATFRKLVEKLTEPDYCTPTFVLHFLLTYRISAAPMELLSYLLARYHHADAQANRKAARGALMRRPVQDCVCKVIETWVDVGFHDFCADTALTTRLLSFVFRDLEGNLLMNDYAMRVKTLIQERVVKPQRVGPTEAQLKSAPAPVLPNLLSSTIDMMELDPLEIARQMTILDHNTFCSIPLTELLGQKWSKDRDSAPHVMAMINRFNTVAAWVVQLLLSYPEASLRAVVYRRLIAVGQYLFALNSFGSACALVGGLGSPAISRLKHTRDLLTENEVVALTELERLISTDKNHSFYRRLLESCTGPCVPYLGLYLADLTFVEDGNPSFITPAGEAEPIADAGRLINWDKRRMLGKILADVRRFQATPYALMPMPALQFWLQSVAGAQLLSDREAYEASLRLEPRET